MVESMIKLGNPLRLWLFTKFGVSGAFAALMLFAPVGSATDTSCPLTKSSQASSPFAGLPEPDSRLLEGFWLHNFGFQLTGFDLWKVLEDLLEGVPFPQPKVIFNIAAGDGSDSYALSAFFSTHVFLQPRSDVQVWAMDNHVGNMRDAQANHAKILRSPHAESVRGIHFSLGDATEDLAYSEWPAFAEITLIRHPNGYLPDYSMWKEIVAQALKRTAVSGLVIMTFYRKGSFEMFAQIVKDLGAPIEKQGAHISGNIGDKYFIILRKPSSSP